jgi:2-haloacid dehalogenase
MKQMKPTVIVFDVKETLLAMSLLKKKVNKFLDSKKGFRIWFGLLMQYSLVDNCTRVYHDFFTIADTTPDMAAIALGITINAERTQETLSKIKKQTAYPDVDEGL